MKKKYFKILAGLVLLISSLISVAVYSQPGDKLKVSFLAVGQGDAILIQTPYEQNILIDGGPGNQVLSGLGNNLPFYDKTIDIMILTHPHSDHVAGLVEILKRYQVKKILYTGVLHTAPDYLAWLEEIKNQNIPLTIVDHRQDIELGQDLKLELLYPLTSLVNVKIENLNDSSIVSRLVYKNKRFLFMGDLSTEGEADLLTHNFDLSADVLKVGHHGSKYSSSMEFLNKVKPEYAVIMVGENNDFGHPHYRALKNLENIQAQILRTDEKGDISYLTDGQNLVVKYSR